jgi:hypothetical protein
MALVDTDRQAFEAFAAGQCLQQLGAGVVVGLEEGGEIVLRQQHGACELGKAEADAAARWPACTSPFFVPVTACWSAMRISWYSTGCNRPSSRPRARRTVQLRAVGDAVDADEIDLRVALAATPAQQRFAGRTG